MAPKKRQSFLNSTLQTNTNNVSMTQDQFTQLLSSLKSKNDRATFSTCTARFHGTTNSTDVDDFIATILVYQEAEGISNEHALLSFPLLLEGYAASWWQGVKSEAKSFTKAIDLLRKNFAPPKPDWRLFAELFQEKQKLLESTDTFVCRKRKMFPTFGKITRKYHVKHDL